MNRPVIIKFLSGLLNVSSCLVIVVAILIRQDWFGKGETYSFIFWTVPLATGIAISGETILNIFRETHFLLRLIIIIVLSIILSFFWVYGVAFILGPWIIVFSIPIFYLWISGSLLQFLFLDWRLPIPSDKPKLSKSLFRLLLFPLTLIVVTIAMLLISSLGSFLTRPEKETYLIPNNFKGNFRIIYGEELGLNPTYENGRRVLQIPDNGILIIKPKFRAGTIDNEYYLVDKNGNRKKMKEVWDYKTIKGNLPCVFLSGSGSMGGKMPDGSWSSESPLAITFTDFIVFNKDTIGRSDSEEYKFQQHFDSLTKALVYKYRQKKEL
jgi:hypothetical protein